MGAAIIIGCYLTHFCTSKPLQNKEIREGLNQPLLCKLSLHKWRTKEYNLGRGWVSWCTRCKSAETLSPIDPAEGPKVAEKRAILFEHVKIHLGVEPEMD